jgi:hypothetical protein
MELNTLTQTNNRLTADAATAERTSAALKAEVLQLQAQAARAESIDRELHQAKWRVSQLEGEVRDTSGDLTYRLTQAQSQLNQAQQQAAQYQQQASQLQAQLVHTQQQLGQAQQQLRSLSSMQNSAAAYAPPPMPAPAPYIVPTYIPPPAPAPIPASLPRSGSTGRLSSNRPLMVDANPAHGRSASGGAFPAYDPNSYQSSYPSAAPSISLAAHASSNPYASVSHSHGGTGNGLPGSHAYGGQSSSGSGRRGAGAGGGLTSTIIDSTASAPFGTARKSPFANDVTSAHINLAFDSLERQLTVLTSEKTSLQEESER